MIECQDVSFSYPASTLPDSERQAGGALKHISCTIEDGSFVLLCGTFRDRLRRLLRRPVQVGEHPLLLDGVDLAQNMAQYHLSERMKSSLRYFFE